MSGVRAAPNAFLNGPNYQKIVGFLRDKYSKVAGGKLPEKADERIKKVVGHYMEEVSRIQAGKPIGTLTQEVLRESTRSMDDWIKKQVTGLPSAITTVGAFPKVEEDYGRLFADTNTNYERMMSERAPPPAAVPPMPDFRTASDILESTEDPVVLMQRMQKQREEQMRAMGIQPAVPPAVASGPASVPAAAVTAPSPPRLEIREEPAPTANKPTPPQAELPPPPLAPRPQDYIIPQEDVVKYLETEYNIFITSSDRDWLRNTAENRYNFSVNFNTGTKRTGFPFSPAIQNRFRNISRIEFVKAIVPIESLTSLVKVLSGPVYDTTRVVNVFSLPFSAVRIAELNNNYFSTNPEEDNTFAIVQYDTTWSSDLSSPAVQGTAPATILTKSGYTGLIPKFLKCQKIYTPTPLGSLNRLTIRVDRHNGTLLSDDSDVWALKAICMSGNFTRIGTDATVYDIDSANLENSYIFLQTNNYFPYSAIGEGDLLNIQGFTPAISSGASLDFSNWMNREEGHYVVATAFVTAAGALTDGRNNAGYCNVIILRSRFADPETGVVARTGAYFGGSLAAENTLAADLDTTGTQPNLAGCALINMSRQTHFVLRIITRDMDSASNIRPDNV
jgi:hypothetical protein